MGAEGSTGPWIVGSIYLKKMGLALLPGSGSPTDGTSGTGAGKSAPGGEYIDYTNAVVWTNIGTKASPKWVVFDALARIPMTQANVQGMFAAPFALVPAPGANRVIIINAITITTIVSTQFASGGAVSAQYAGGAAAHTGTVPAATINSASVSTTQLGPLAGGNGSTLTVNAALQLTNATGAFTGGAGSSLIVSVSYEIAATV